MLFKIVGFFNKAWKFYCKIEDLKVEAQVKAGRLFF